MTKNNELLTLLACARLVEADPNMFLRTLPNLSPGDWHTVVSTTVRRFVIDYNQMLAARHEPTPQRQRPTETELEVAAAAYEYWSCQPHFAEMIRGVRTNYIYQFHGANRQRA